MKHSGDERILRRLSSGDTDPILVADFQAMSMSPRLSDMLSERIQGRAVFQIDPIGVLSGERWYVPLPELAAACADEFRESGAQHGRVIVIGHCSAAPLALHVAGLLAHDRAVTAVLVNPTWPGDEHVTVKFDEFLAKFGPAARPAPDLNDDPELVVSAMAQILLDEVTALAASRGVSSSAGAFSDLIVWYRAWLAFLLAGRNDRQIRRAAGQAAVTVLSDSPSQVTVPGRNENTYLVRELPPQPVGAVTPELAEIVTARVAPSQSSIA
ncbi:alpha/beta fold hydrolase [Actinoplanes sp. NPDC026623]|uniref:alpha/beta fold hydrolase n=1 Tax=Actinoplanes sp. NPDC026623 TaxID=3155610 RepID=UPI0033D01CED